MNKYKILLIIILLISFILRIWSIQFGLPRALYPDEIVVIHNAFVIMAKGILQGFSGYAILTSYLMIPILGLQYILGRILGWYSDPSSFYTTYSLNPTTSLLAGRFEMVFISVGLVYLTYLIGKDLFDEKKGLVAAWFLGTGFLSTAEGMYLKDDTLVAFLTLLSFRFAIKKKPLLSGIFIGIAIASHYYPVAIIPALLYLILLNSKTSKLKQLIKFTISSIITFLITNPHIVLTPQYFITGFLNSWNYRHTETIGSYGFGRWLLFTKDLLIDGWGLLPLLMMVVGIIVCLKSRQKILLVILSTFILLYGSLLLGGAEFARFGLIVLPFVSLLSAISIFFVSKISLNYQKIIFFSLCLILPITNVIRIIKLKILLSAPDIRYEAEQWIEKNIPENSKLLIDGYQTPIGLSFQNVYVFYTHDVLDQYRISAKKLNQPQYIYDILDRLAVGHTRYNLTTVPKLDVSWNSEQSKYEIVKSSAWIKNTLDYVIASNWVQNAGKIDDNFWIEFNKNWVILKEFSANPQLKYNPLGWKYDMKGIDAINLFDPKLKFGPKITIYQKRDRN